MNDLLSPASVLAAHTLAKTVELFGPLVPLRLHGIDLLKRRGLPSSRDEAWRFTDVRAVTDFAFERPSKPDAARIERLVSPLKLPEIASLTLLAGYEDPSEPFARMLPPGIQCWASDDPGEAPEWARPALNAQTPAPFAALNGSSLQKLWCIRITGSPPPLALIYPMLAGEAPSMSAPRVSVVVEAGARACLIEMHTAEASPAPTFTNSVSLVSVGDDAELEHIRVSLGALSNRQISTVTASLGRDSRYHSRLITLGGALARTDLGVTFSAPGASAELDGLYFAAHGEQVDHHTLVEHQVGQCQSAQKYKGLADGNGQAIFDGIVRVHRGARGSSAEQQNRNVLLSENAVVHTKPHLEIENDDVKCTHGATVGRLRLEEQFYLQTRGIDPITARTLLTYAFASEILDRIAEPSVRAFVRRAFLTKLGSPELFAELG